MTMQQYANNGWLVEAQRRLFGCRTPTELRRVYAESLSKKPEWVSSHAEARLRQWFNYYMHCLDKPKFQPSL